MEQAQQQGQRRPSLVVCPPTLVGHWPHEIAKFVGDSLLRTLQYEGPPAQRRRLQAEAETQADVVVMAYETLRSDVDWAARLQWNYCVLDEGHMIRNPKSRIAQVAAWEHAAMQHGP